MTVASHRTVEVPCTLEIEHTPDSLHAHVELDGIEVGPGRRGHRARRRRPTWPIRRDAGDAAPRHHRARGPLERLVTKLSRLSRAHRAVRGRLFSREGSHDRRWKAAAPPTPRRRCDRKTPSSARASTRPTSTMDNTRRLDAVRAEWDELIEEMRSDHNKGPLPAQRRLRRLRASNAVPEDLRKELIDFLVSSLTAEFSGCVLYAEIKKRIKNPDIRELFAS
jgi:hypothetical protein